MAKRLLNTVLFHHRSFAFCPIDDNPIKYLMCSRQDGRVREDSEDHRMKRGRQTTPDSALYWRLAVLAGRLGWGRSQSADDYLPTTFSESVRNGVVVDRIPGCWNPVFRFERDFPRGRRPMGTIMHFNRSSSSLNRSWRVERFQQKRFEPWRAFWILWIHIRASERNAKRILEETKNLGVMEVNATHSDWIRYVTYRDDLGSGDHDFRCDNIIRFWFSAILEWFLTIRGF